MPITIKTTDPILGTPVGSGGPGGGGGGTPPPPPPGSVLYGSSSNNTSAQGVAATDAKFGGLHIFRSYDPGMAGYSGSSARHTPAGCGAIWYSCKPGDSSLSTDWSTTANQAQLVSIISSFPTDKTLYFTAWHEPDHKRLNPTRWRALQTQVTRACATVRATQGRTNIYAVSVVTAFAVPAGRFPDYYAPDVDIVAFDSYDDKYLIPSAKYAIAHGKPWALGEFNQHNPTQYSDAQRAAAVKSSYEIWSGNTSDGVTEPPTAVCWFDSNVGGTFYVDDAAWSQTTAAVRSLCTLGSV